MAVEFYWRETIESLHSAIDTGEAYICSGGDSLTLINNNLHQALLEQQLFVDLEHRWVGASSPYVGLEAHAYIGVLGSCSACS